MTDWTKQTEDLIKTWTEAQQKMWDSWLGTMQRPSSGASQVTEAWEQSVGAWRQAVEQALAAQVEWTQKWADTTSAGANVPKEVADWSRQVVDVMQRWTETQKAVWERWFDTLKQADPATVATSWADEAQKVTKAWQEAAQKALEAQQEWARRAAAVAQAGPDKS